MVMPGDNFRATVDLNLAVAMDVGLRFAIRDSGRTVGAGVVTKLINQAGLPALRAGGGQKGPAVAAVADIG